MIEDYYVSCVRKRATTDLTKSRPSTTYTNTSINGYRGTGSSTNKELSGQQTHELTYKFYCDDFDLQANDLIVYENETYRVKYIQNTVHKNHHVKALLYKVRNITKEV